MKLIYTDSLVVGAGLAGLRVAIASKERGLDTLVLSLIPAKRSHSAAAQGGMQASLGNAVKGMGDDEDVHFQDTVKGSDWGCDQEVARMFAHCAPKAVRELANWGVPWSRVSAGPREVIVNAQRSLSMRPRKLMVLSTPVILAGLKSGEPVTPQMGLVTHYCMRWITKRFLWTFPSMNVLKPWRLFTMANAVTA